MQFNIKTLQDAGDQGAKKVAEAFGKLSGAPAESRSKVEFVPAAEVGGRLKRSSGQAVVAYGQIMAGIAGISLLTMPRENALNLVDLLNQQPIGTTGILKDIDRSAIKEILNILSNSYLTALSESVDMDLGLGVPNMITSERIIDIAETVVLGKGDKPAEKAVVFETTITLSAHRITASLYLLFSEQLVEVINKGNNQ